MVFKLSVALAALLGLASAAKFKNHACPGGKHTASNPACCVFYNLRDDLQQNLFGHECSEDAHEVLRLTFHDAIGYSKSGKLAGHGADGSIIVFKDIETADPDNAGIADSVEALEPFLAHYNVTPGDLIQFAGAVGITNCPGAPRLQFLAGRPTATAAAQRGSLPGAGDTPDAILARVGDAGLTPAELVHLLASHSVARADHVNPAVQHAPFDSTPFTFDTQFFLEVLLRGTGYPAPPGAHGELQSPLPAQGEMRLQSDFALARDRRTACEWQRQINNQQLMMKNFASAMAKMAVLGQKVSKLTDCSEVIPAPKPPTGKPASYPAGKSLKDMDHACPKPYPVLKADRGQPTHIPACPNGETTCPE